MTDFQDQILDGMMCYQHDLKCALEHRATDEQDYDTQQMYDVAEFDARFHLKRLGMQYRLEQLRNK